MPWWIGRATRQPDWDRPCRLLPLGSPAVPARSSSSNTGKTVACPNEPLRIRQPIAVRVYTGVFGLIWCGFVATGFLSLVPRPESLIPLGMLVFGATLTSRLVRVEAVADDSGLLVRNYYRTRTYKWSEVEDFRLGNPTMGLPIGKVIHVLLASGEITTLDVTMRPLLLSRGKEKLDGYIRQLRAWVDRP